MDNTTKQTSTENTTQHSSTGKNGNPLILIGIVLLIALVAGGAYYLGVSNSKSNSYQTIKQNGYATPTTEPNGISITPPGNSQSSNMVIFNLNGGAPNLKYFISQISAPNNYYATDDNMIDSYATQGGMAPPRVILMKNYQVTGSSLSGQSDYYSAIRQSKNDCIVIWSTDGFSSIDDWNNTVTSLKGNLTEHQEISVGTRKAQMYKMLKSEGDIYVALLQIGNKDNISYYFHTCNANNKSDFINVVQSIKFRDDIHF